ncbi:MAG: DnaA N-terminal domain-containing protein [Rickettsiales bacterium]
MSKLLINENPLMVLPTLAVKIGLNEAILLQQVHYWIDPRINKNYINGKFWVYNTLDKWLSQFPFWSKSTLRRTIKNLEENNLLLSTNRVIKGFDQTKWYSINYDALEQLDLLSDSPVHNEHIEKSKMNKSVTQIEQIDLSRVSSSNMHIDHSQVFKVNRTYNRDTENTTENTTHTNSENNLSDFLQDYEDIINPNNTYKPVHLDKKRRETFTQILKNNFNCDRQKWKEFLELIANSGFLMGKVTSFKVHFDWLTREENIKKVLEGAYSARKEETVENADNVAKSINDNSELFLNSLNGKEKEVYLLLSELLGKGTFVSWLTRTKPYIDYTNNIFSVTCDSKFVKNWIQTNYNNQIQKALENLDVSGFKIRYNLASQES